MWALLFQANKEADAFHSGSGCYNDFCCRRCSETYRRTHSLTRVGHEDVPSERQVESFGGVFRILSDVIGRAEERVAKLVDSPDRPESEASYKLDEGGWADV